MAGHMVPGDCYYHTKRLQSGRTSQMPQSVLHTPVQQNSRIICSRQTSKRNILVPDAIRGNKGLWRGPLSCTNMGQHHTSASRPKGGGKFAIGGLRKSLQPGRPCQMPCGFKKPRCLIIELQTDLFFSPWSENQCQNWRRDVNGKAGQWWEPSGLHTRELLVLRVFRRT